MAGPASLTSTRKTPMAARRTTLIIVTFLLVSAAASPLLAWLQSSTALDPTVLRLTTFSTAVGAGVTWLAWRRSFVWPPVTKRDTGRALGISLAVAAVSAAGLLLLNALEGNRWSPVEISALPAPLVLILFTQFLGAVGEEVGWRGLVQPLFETTKPVLWSGIVTGLLFGLGHFYVIAAGPILFATFVLSAVALSVILAFLTTGRSVTVRIVVASVFHWLTNTATFVLFADGDESLLWVANTALVGVAGAIAMVVLARRKLRR